MPLTIVTNDSCFHGDRDPNAHPAHLGTPDRDRPDVMFDSPAKARAALEVAEQTSASRGSMTVLHSERTPALEALTAGHSSDYVQSLRQASEAASLGQDGSSVISFGKEAAASRGTFLAASRAVGASFTAIDTVLQSPHSTSFALVWPPGHHAEREQAMGFCYLSNAGLAALYAARHSERVGPTQANRVAVIDIDHHRANGTASVLAGHEDTLLVDLCYRSPYDASSRSYLDEAREYPYTRDDAKRAIQAHALPAAPNVVPIEFEGIQKPERIIERFIAEGLPRLREFKPDVIIWSVGLDSLQGDPLGGLGNLPGSFYTMIRGVRCAFPNARHMGILEGGYDRSSFGESLPPVLLALDDDPAADPSRSSLFKRYRSAFESAHELCPKPSLRRLRETEDSETSHSALVTPAMLNGEQFLAAVPLDSFNSSRRSQKALAHKLGGRLATREESLALAAALLEREAAGAISDVDARILSSLRSGYMRDARGSIHIEGTQVHEHNRFLNLFKAVPIIPDPELLLRIHAEERDGALVVLSRTQPQPGGLAERILVDSWPLSVAAASLGTIAGVVVMNAPLGVAVQSSLLVGAVAASWVAFAGVISNLAGRRH